ncbi:MAG: flagellar basal body-associated protein FliL [bacterium]
MANDNVKKDQESAEATDDQNGEKKGGMLKIILIPVILLIQAAAAYYIVFNVLLKHPNHVEEPKPKKENLEVGQFYEITDLVINPAESGGRRYLVLELALETDNSKLLEEATSKEIWIRDAIITLLTKKTAEELLELSIRKKLKKQILETLNNRMAEGKFERIYFKKYLLQ